MSLERKVKTRTIAFKATDELHTAVVDFCGDRGWNMSKFLERAVIESLDRVSKREYKKAKEIVMSLENVETFDDDYIESLIHKTIQDMISW